MEIFEDEGDYRAFEALLRETCERFKIRLLTYCLMPEPVIGLSPFFPSPSPLFAPAPTHGPPVGTDKS